MTGPFYLIFTNAYYHIMTNTHISFEGTSTIAKILKEFPENNWNYAQLSPPKFFIDNNTVYAHNKRFATVIAIATNLSDFPTQFPELFI